MTVERYKWNCPGCGQMFGIKKGTAAPSLCADCVKQRQPVSSEAGQPAIESSGKTVEFTIPEIPTIDEKPDFLQGLSSSETSSPTSVKKTSRRSSRGKYNSFRKLSTFYQVLAFLILIGSGIGTVFAISLKLDYWYTGAIFGGGIVFSLILSGLGVILRIVIDIEANSRDQ